jgi:hypothetical protein
MTPNRTFRSFITWLLIASPLWWTIGCYSFREVIKLDEAKENERNIEVTTKGNSVYIFMKWSVDSLGAITGRAKWHNPNYMAHARWDVNAISGELQFLEGPKMIPHDSVYAIKAEYYDTGMTVLAGLGIAAGAALVAFVVLLSQFAGYRVM